MFNYLKLLRKYNTLESKYNSLEETVKEDCFKQLIMKIGEPLEIKRLRDENKRLRLKVKELKNLIKKSWATLYV